MRAKRAPDERRRAWLAEAFANAVSAQHSAVARRHLAGCGIDPAPLDEIGSPDWRAGTLPLEGRRHRALLARYVAPRV